MDNLSLLTVLTQQQEAIIVAIKGRCLEEDQAIILVIWSTQIQGMDRSFA